MSVSITLKAAALAALLAAAGAALAHGRAHVHGAAQLEVAVDGGRITVRFEAPMDSLVGFEHAPRTEAQRQEIARLRQTLEDPLALFAPDAAAGCQVLEQRAASPLFTGKSAGEHSELEYEFTLGCAAPERLTGIEVRAFERFRRLERVSTQAAGPSGQRAHQLNRNSRRLPL